MHYPLCRSPRSGNALVLQHFVFGTLSYDEVYSVEAKAGKSSDDSHPARFRVIELNKPFTPRTWCLRGWLASRGCRFVVL